MHTRVYLRPRVLHSIAHSIRSLCVCVCVSLCRLSEMILDGKLAGILDQGTGDLILFSDVEGDKSYANADGTVKELNSVVDRLYVRAKQLTK